MEGIPQEEEIVSRQHALIWSVSEDFRKYLPHIDSYIDEKRGDSKWQKLK